MNGYLPPRITNIPQTTPNYGPGQYIGLKGGKNIHMYCFPTKLDHTCGKLNNQIKKYYILQNVSIITICSLLVKTHEKN